MLISLAQASKKKYDLIILGSGPAGISTAITFNKLHPSKTVLIIESGGKEHNSQISSLSDVDAKGDLDNDFLELSSQRVFGGTSCYWGGWCATFESSSFLNGHWPIQYKELFSYYKKAAQVLELDKSSFTKASENIDGTIIYKPWFFATKGLFSKKKKIVRFGEKYEHLLSKSENIDVVLKCTVSKLFIEEQAVKKIEIVNSLQKTERYLLHTANCQVVLAAGGIGNANILLQSGYNHPQLGKNLMEHPHLYRQIRYGIRKDLFDKVENKRTRVVHGFQLNSDYLYKKNIPINATYEFSKNMVTNEIIKGKPYILYETKAHLRTEMLPKESNRVYLSNEKNYLGLRKMKVDFYFDKSEIEQNINEFISYLLRNNLGRPYLVKKPYDITGGNHLMGTTKMGYNIKDSIVDNNLKMHACKNCYITGASVFPSSDASNPTYTVVAISIRLGEYLSKII